MAAEPRPPPPRGAGAEPSGAAKRGPSLPRSRAPLKSWKPEVFSSQEPSPSAISSLSWTSEHNVTRQALQTSAQAVVLVLSVLVLLVTSAAILLLAQQCRRQAKVLHPCPGLVCGDTNIHTFLHSSSPGPLEAPEAGDSWKEVALVPLLGRELPNLASQPLSRLLDELEVLEELIVLLDPEPGPGGGMACGTTRHLAARYGVPAAWSTFVYSLRPSRSPLRALIEMVVAREPSASLGQLGTHLAQLGRADALQVLSKLG